MLDTVLPKCAERLRECQSDDECLAWKIEHRRVIGDLVLAGEGQPQDEGAGFSATVISRVCEIRKQVAENCVKIENDIKLTEELLAATTAQIERSQGLMDNNDSTIALQNLKNVYNQGLAKSR